MSKKLIVFQLWGSNSLYFVGMVENIKLAEIIYQDWKIRIYYDDIKDEWVKYLADMNVEMVHVNKKEGASFQLWRMLPLFDDDVEYFICRDADSRLNYREYYAVEEWIKSNKPMHIMRDHPIGHKTLVLAGMCGFNNTEIRKTIVFKDPLLLENAVINAHDSDQEFIRKYIYVFFENNHLAHDKYRHFKTGCERDFPVIPYHIPRMCNFVGEVVDHYNNPIEWKTKSLFDKIDYDKIDYNIVYGEKIPSELECIRLNNSVMEIDHVTPYKYYSANFFIKALLNKLDILEQKMDLLKY